MFTVVREMYQGVKVDVFMAHTNYPDETPCLEWEGTYDSRRRAFFEANDFRPHRFGGGVATARLRRFVLRAGKSRQRGGDDHD